MSDGTERDKVFLEYTSHEGDYVSVTVDFPKGKGMLALNALLTAGQTESWTQAALSLMDDPSVAQGYAAFMESREREQ